MRKGTRVLSVVLIQGPLVNALACIIMAVAVASTTKYEPVLVSPDEVLDPHWWNYLFPWLLELAVVSGTLCLTAAMVTTVLARRRPFLLFGRRPIVFAWSMVLLVLLFLATTGALVMRSVLRAAGV